MEKNHVRKYQNRELSWLEFNDRVLQEAADLRTPLLERIRFLAIFSSNQDEFFRIRVATLSRIIALKKKATDELGFRHKDVLKEIFSIVAQQQRRFLETYRQIKKQLELDEKLFILDENGLDAEQGEYVKAFFKENVRPRIFPLMLKALKDQNSLKDKALYLAVDLCSSENTEKEDYALIKVPVNQLGRFLVLPEKEGKRFIILLDDVIRYCVNDIFAPLGYDKFVSYTVKFTRDAELDIDNDVKKSFLELMQQSLKRRTKGEPVRFVYDRDIPDELLKVLNKKLGLSKDDTHISGGKYHNFRDFMSFPKLENEHLTFPEMPPLNHPDFSHDSNIFNVVREKDVLLFYPFQSFRYIIDLLRIASIDPYVTSVKMTLYRVAKNSSVINALVNAARNGKKVTVFLEVQARFDEKANIQWAEKLQEEGVQVIHAIPGFKVHSKLLLVKRRENGKLRYYANVGTGNFNEETARLYSDIGLLTSKPEITAEVDQVFDLFEASYTQFSWKQLVVSPFNQRKHFVKLLNKEIRNAKAGKKAWAMIKINSLVDKQLVDKLYQASRAGVEITLIIRGICTLIPGVENMSENIEVISIVDRFLEHTRAFIFCNGGDNLFYLGSADWMGRNLDNRIEVSCPVEDPVLQKQMLDVMNIQLADNQKARLMGPDGDYRYKNPRSSKKVRSQIKTYEYFKDYLNQNT